MLNQEAMELRDKISQVRRYLHAHPELSFKEKATTAYLKNALEAMGIPVTTFPDHYGLTARIGTAKSGKTLLLRADIDALPIVEKSGVSFASGTEGVMHACGHDAHMAMLLGAAELLKRHEAELGGTVLLLFQSGEESGHGAKWYVDRGIADNVDACFALHVQPDVPAGKFSLDPGFRSASCTDFSLTVRGTAAHGSTPHLGHDAIVAASAAIMNAQTLVSRVNNALNPLVVTFGKVTAGHQFNIIMNMQARDIEKVIPGPPSNRAPVELCMTVVASILDGVAAESIPVRFICNTPPGQFGDDMNAARSPEDKVGEAVFVSPVFRGTPSVIGALRMLATLELMISVPIEKMLDHILENPYAYTSGGNMIFVSSYLDERMINFTYAMRKMGVTVIFYITSTSINAHIIPEDIEVHFRTYTDE